MVQLLALPAVDAEWFARTVVGRLRVRSLRPVYSISLPEFRSETALATRAGVHPTQLDSAGCRVDRLRHHLPSCTGTITRLAMDSQRARPARFLPPHPLPFSHPLILQRNRHVS